MSRRFIALILGATLFAVAAHGGDDAVAVGAGSYALTLPAGAKEPPAQVFKTDAVQGPLPTNDWWSSLLWLKFSEPQFAHPLVVKAEAGGLRVYYPGPAIYANKIGIFGEMAGKSEDFVLGHSAQAQFPDARLDGFSDWFVTARFAAEGKSLSVAYGHGSPFVYALYKEGQPLLTFASVPAVWSGDEKSAVLGVAVNKRHYGLFGPSGSTWAGVGSKALTCQTAKEYFSIALLPDNKPETLALFQRHAYAHVTDTKVQWAFDQKTSRVTTTYSFTTKAHEGTERETLFALYQHQWKHTTTALLDSGYDSVRGRMKLARGSAFSTEMTFPGVLPALPDAGGYDKDALRAYVTAEANAPSQPLKDTYWGGKDLGRMTSVVPIAEQVGDTAAAQKLLGELKKRLERWFTAADSSGKVKKANVFYYNKTWGTLIGYPASFDSDTQLNDHHFHYGYFVRAAAEVARHDPAWASDAQWGGMVKLLIRDIAGSDRSDKLFPFLRNFDVYAGHSWASGHAKFASGNNNESSSEGMAAWTGMILWGAATNDTALRDLGIYLYTTELAGINNYWFDVLGENRPAAYTPSVVTMVWGGKSVNETWFSNKPPIVHGINFLPFHGGSLYLGLYPEYVKRNYDALLRENGNDNWADWPCIIWMYRALDDPADAIRQFSAREKNFPSEAGNSKANLYHWLYTLTALGQVDRTVTADWPLYAVFKKGTARTCAAYNTEKAQRTVTFSDGTKVVVEPGAFGVGKR